MRTYDFAHSLAALTLFEFFMLKFVLKEVSHITFFIFKKFEKNYNSSHL